MINVNSQKIAELENEQLARSMAKDKAEELEISINKANEDLLPVEEVWLSEEETPEFLNFIEGLGDISGTDVSIVNITDLSESGSGLSILLSIDGSFGNLFKTIRLIENSSYAVDFRRVYLSRNEENGLWRADLDIRILSFKK